MNTASLHTLPALPAAIRGLSNNESLHLSGDEARRWKSPSQCQTCSGKGTFQWYAEGSRDDVVTYQCPCDEQWLLHRYLLNAGIGLSYQRLGWEDALHVDPSAREMVDTYLANMDAMLARGLGLLLHGGIQGTGKSLMAILTLKGILAKGHDCYFTTFSGLIERLMSGWDSKEQKAWFHSRIRNATVLVVDDVGREMKQRRMTSDGMKDYNTATSEFAIESVLRHRVANALPTIVTTNLSVDQLRDSYGQHFRSLMGEAMLQVAFRGTDWRSSSAQRLWQEAQSGLMRPVVLG